MFVNISIYVCFISMQRITLKKFLCTVLDINKCFQIKDYLFWTRILSCIRLHSYIVPKRSNVAMLSILWKTLIYFMTLSGYFRQTSSYIITWVTRQVYFKKQELLTLRKYLVSAPAFNWVRIDNLFGFLCSVCFAYLRSVSCVQCLPVSLDFPFLICRIGFM